MAEDFIEEIYGYAETTFRLRKVIEHFRYEEDFYGAELFQRQVPKLEKFLEACVKDEYPESDILREKLYSIQDIGDSTVVADLLESTVIPIMERWIQSWVAVDEQVDPRYKIESTAVGFLTIKDTQADRYLHSNNDPMDEARKIVENQFQYDKESYVVWGCGMGYHIYQLYRVSEGTIPITVYEPNPNLIKYALQYGVLSWIPKEILQIVPGCSGEEFLASVKETDGVFFLLPYIHAMQNALQKNLLMERYLQESADWEVKKELKFNFCRNKEWNFPDVHEIDRSLMKREMVVVGGGPSADDSMELLREWQGKKTIIAVGTIWKRLLDEQIRPDYAVVMDPYSGIGCQTEGIKDTGTVLLLNILAYWKIARTYKGSIYTICVSGPRCGVEQYAKEKKLEIWESGGNVGALAIEFAIRFGAEKIYFTGIDLAFRDGMDHAEGTAYRGKVDESKTVTVEGNYENTVHTNATFLLYKKWLEERIAKTKGITFLNMSKTGAKIVGSIPYGEDL